MSDSIAGFVGDALDRILATHLYFRQNSFSALQAALLLVVPPVSTYLIAQHAEFGFRLGVEPGTFPLIVVVLFLSSIYLMMERLWTRRRPGDLSKFFLTTVAIFTVALLFSVFYSTSLLVIYGRNPPDILANNIQNALFTTRDFSHLLFATAYSLPFLLLSLIILAFNSFSKYPRRSRLLLRSALFWRSLIAASLIALYQLVIFVLIGTVVSMGL
jgi:hypothetical protein